MKPSACTHHTRNRLMTGRARARRADQDNLRSQAPSWAVHLRPDASHLAERFPRPSRFIAGLEDPQQSVGHHCAGGRPEIYGFTQVIPLFSAQRCMRAYDDDNSSLATTPPARRDTFARRRNSEFAPRRVHFMHRPLTSLLSFFGNPNSNRRREPVGKSAWTTRLALTAQRTYFDSAITDLIVVDNSIPSTVVNVRRTSRPRARHDGMVWLRAAHCLTFKTRSTRTTGRQLPRGRRCSATPASPAALGLLLGAEVVGAGARFDWPMNHRAVGWAGTLFSICSCPIGSAATGTSMCAGTTCSTKL
jgi:hypothetical protein